MADAVELAAAYVSIVPSFEGGRDVIGKELVPQSERAGKEAGEQAGKGWNDRFSSFVGSGAVKAGAAAAAAGLGLALVDGFSQAVEGADSGAKLTAQMGLSPEQSAAAGKASGGLYAGAYGESLSDVNTAVGAVMSSMSGMRDASAADIEDITAKAMNLSTAFDVDVSEAATTAGIVMKNGLAGDADQAMDLITAAMQKVPAGVRGEVLPVMDEYSKHFAALGIDGNTAFGIIAASSADGAIGMDKMGDALKEFTIRGTDMSKTTSEAYESLGLSTEDMTAKLLEGGPAANDAMGQIVHALQGVEDPAAQSAAALALFGTPLEDLGTDQIPDFLGMIDPMGDQFADVAGAADTFGATLNSGPGPALESLKRSVQGAFTSMITVAMPALTALAGWVTENEWVIASLAAGIGVGLVGAFIAWAASVWAATVALLANPVTWIVLGVAALAAGLVALIANWDSVVAFVTDVWGGFVTWLTEGLAKVGAEWSAFWSGVSEFAQEIWGGFTDWLFAGLAKVGADWTAFWSGVGEFFSDSWNNIKAAAVSIFTGLVSWWLGWLARVYIGFTVGINRVKTWLSTTWTNIKNTAAGIWNALASWFVSWATRVYSGFTGGIGRVRDWLAGAWRGIKDTAVNIWNGLVDWVRGVPDRFLSNLSAIANLAVRMGGWIGSVKDAAVDKFLGLVDWVRGVPDRVVGALGSLGSLLSSAGSSIMQGFLDGLTATWNKVTDFVGGIGDWIAENKGPLPYDRVLLKPAGTAIMGGLNKSIRAAIPELARTLGDVTRAIEVGTPARLDVGAAAVTSAAGYDVAGGGAAGGGDRVFNFHGNVGWLPDEVAERIETRERRAAVLSGLSGVVLS